MHNKLKGVLYGQAIGDALGLATEFMSKSLVNHLYSEGITGYESIVQDAHRQRWQKGDWTDDTDQMLCIWDSLLEKQKLDILDIARRFYSWAVNGGIGIGNTVYDVLFSPDFLSHPHRVAKRVWESSGRRAAANGAIMRTSILGAWNYNDLEEVIYNTEQVCQITHYDPRCVGSCVAVTMTISLLLQGKSHSEIMGQVIERVKEYDPQIEPYLLKAQEESLEVFDLDEGLNPGDKDCIGYTLKAMGAAFWALKSEFSFYEALMAIIYEGGDADTNAAVAGALLGAKHGFAAIPEFLITGLKYQAELQKRVEILVAKYQ